MRVEQSAIIRRTPDEVFTFLENRANDTAWMKSVMQSEWLDSSGAARVGRRGRMVIKIFGRRNKFIDEVTEYVPGRRIAHRTIEGPFPLNTACICEPAEHGCLATVVGEVDRVPGGWIGRLTTPFVGRILQHGFKADLARLKALLEPQPDGRELLRAQMRDSPTMKDFGDFYNARKAASELRRYRNKGPIPSTKMLIDALKTEGVEGATVIDIGGGIGAVQHELLAAGAAHVTSVDASDAYIRHGAGGKRPSRPHRPGHLPPWRLPRACQNDSSRRYRDARPRHQRLSRLEAINSSLRGTSSPPLWPRLSARHSARQDGRQCDEPARMARTRPCVCALAGRDRQADQ